jgi:hypothetical protein
MAKKRCFFPELENQLEDELTNLRSDGNVFIFTRIALI